MIRVKAIRNIYWSEIIYGEKEKKIAIPKDTLGKVTDNWQDDWLGVSFEDNAVKNYYDDRITIGWLAVPADAFEELV